MQRPLGILLAIACTAVCGRAQDPLPRLTGIVTDVASSTSFKVLGQPVVCIPNKTDRFINQLNGQNFLQKICTPLTLGDTVQIYGKDDKKQHAIVATRIAYTIPHDLPAEGIGLIDRVLQPASSGTLTVRADGYTITTDATTKTTFPEADLTTASAVNAGVWMQYTGTLRPDGTVLAKAVVFYPNHFTASEDHLIAKTEFDADSVDEGDRQNPVLKYLLGADPKRIPAFKDEAMQARLQTIGDRLIPAYQKALPPGDPARIDFRFQLVDEPHLQTYWALPSGIILVPHTLLQKLSDDAQLASVLAAAIAIVLDKQLYRALPTMHALTATRYAGMVAGAFVPGLGLVTGITTARTTAVMQQHQEEQQCRLSLALLQDAGFDIRQAPRAWWLLHAKDEDKLPTTPLPRRSVYLYGLLATAWRTQLAQP